MADVQSKYSAIPYGWKEIDIAAVVAQLIYSQKVTIKYAGNTIQPDDPKLPDMLRKRVKSVRRLSANVKIFLLRCYVMLKKCYGSILMSWMYRMMKMA